jgi:pyruvate,water dikinase
MLRIFSFIKESLFPAPPPVLSPEELAEAFRKRYAHFRSLLTANNNALQAMADLEKIYYGGDSYRMAVIRSKITTILVNVYKMVRSLLAMSSGRYGELEKIFDTINSNLEQITERKPELPQGPFIMGLPELGLKDATLAGDKMACLGELTRLPGVTVPPGFVLTATATRKFLTSEHLAEINRRLQVLDPDNLDALYKGCHGIQTMILDLPLPADLEELLLVHYSRLEKAAYPGCRVSMRSSALGEDSATVSFAGLYNSVLNVDRTNIVAAYKEVIAGKYGARAIAYRRQRGYRHEDIEMCVGCMVMVDALVSGVIYSIDPGQEDSGVLRINATAGIAKGVVDGSQAADLFLIGRDKPYPVVYSEIRQVAAKQGSAQTAGPSLTYTQLRKLAETALSLEEHFGEPQDIEWSFDQQGLLYILQSRPLTGGHPEKEMALKPVVTGGESSEPPIIFGGVCAGSGIASGEVFHVDSPEAMRRFPKGGILLLDHPMPEWAPLLNRAAAVIAEGGTEAGHLATVSREFGIPALFGLPEATKLLENGRTITLHATGRAVFDGRREDLLRQKNVKKDIMAGSPVQRILTEALQLITPLNLNDPASPRFKSSWCETLHDITRFCHEKSVTEMFSFGQTHRFDQSAAKQLIGDVPLEWWVIDLSGGFRDGAGKGVKTIRIEDIVSIPMLAIWRGISAYPWHGPPRVSMRGFGSIIFQSTMRPELDPTVPSALTTKNYFLISKNFCNLSVRLGYHYAMIEAYLSDLLTESYVTFRFKGGAADQHRKAVRTRLLADILLEYDFRIELRSDSLLARVKKRSVEFLEERLQVLGYLTLHARQLDMVMDQPGVVDQYREKFLREIEEMLGRISHQARLPCIREVKQ